ncbi:MAG: PorV/PorQ family protein [Elusimicrobiota bacterium]|nr:PorV/PorQ family protein [Elusimicrobiota bacterium]
MKNYKLKIKNEGKVVILRRSRRISLLKARCFPFISFRVSMTLCVIFHFTFFISNCLYAASSTAEFLRINPSALASSMGGASVALDGKVDSLYSNPSGIASIKSPQLFTGYTSYIQDIKLAGLSFAKPFGENVFGCSIIYLGLNSMAATDDSGQPSGTASANNFSFSFSWARNIRDNFGAGLSVKQVHQKYDDVSSDGFSADIGGMYKIKNVSFGISLQNFGPEIDSQKLPSTIRAGAVYTFTKNPLSVSAEIEKPVLADIKFKTGAEYEVAPKIYFRGGYEYLRETGVFSGISAGLGFKTTWQESYMESDDGKPVKKIGVNLDYAFSYFGDLGNIHKVSMGFEF